VNATVMSDQAQAVQAAKISEDCVLLDVSFGCWGRDKKVARGDVDVQQSGTGTEVPQEAVRLTKRLMECEEYDAIISADGAFRRKLAGIAIPYRRRGMFIVPMGLVLRIQQECEDNRAKRYGMIDALMGVYEVQQAKEQLRLGPLYNASDYPTAAEVRGKFTYRWDWLEQKAASKLQSVSGALYAAQRESMAAEWSETGEEIRMAMRQMFVQLVEGLRERLDWSDTAGKPKRIYDTRVSGLQDWLALFEARNVTGDEELAKMVATAKSYLDGVDTETLRKSDVVRANTAKALGAIKAACAEVGLADAPRRKFRLTDD